MRLSARFSYRLRTIVLVLLALCVILGLVAHQVHHASRQAIIARALVREGWTVNYQPSAANVAEMPIRGWIASQLGLDFVSSPAILQVGNEVVPTDEQLALASKLTSVEMISIVPWKSNVTDDGICQLSHLPQLHTLLVHNSSITDRSLECLAEAGTIRELYISGAAFTSQSLASLRELPLRRLRIRNAGLSEESKDALRQALPRCKIEFE